jgi:polar amino acid transport system substrate-binding protein
MNDKIRVAVAEIPPLIINDRGKYHGFEIELWEAIAKKLSWQFEYLPCDFQNIIATIKEGKADIGIAGITINEEREKIIDFTHPTLNSGLLILISKDRDKISIGNTLKNIASSGKGILIPFLLVLGVAIIFSNILLLAERDVQTFSPTYFPAIFEAMWLIIVSVTTVGFGDFVPHTWAGRGVIALVLFIGIAVFGVMVAQISAFLSAKKLKSSINGIEDLRGRTVASVAEATSTGKLLSLGSRIVTFRRISEAFRKLENGKVDAVVFDAPAVAYYANSKEGEKTRIVGEIFDKQSYGFITATESPLREPINQALLHLKENGFYEKLYKKWFGEYSMME